MKFYSYLCLCYLFLYVLSCTSNSGVSQKDEPVLQELQVTLSTGSIVMLEGVIESNAMRFSVDLISGSARSPDIAFHLNPRLQQRVVVRNSRSRGHWGTEELGAVEKFPFSRGKCFSLQVLCAEEEFMVAVNGRHFCSFTYRVPVAQIRLIQVSGGVSMKRMEYKQCDKYPVIDGSEKEKNVLPVSETASLSCATRGSMVCTPLTLSLPSKLSEGKTLEISGKVKLLPYLFYINLQQGTQMWPHPEIPLHVNPRFGEKGPVIICNSWSSGKWGQEEREAITGLRASKEFTLQINCEADSYVIILNGISVYEFSHRVSPKIVDCIFVLGDILVKEVNLR